MSDAIRSTLAVRRPRGLADVALGQHQALAHATIRGHRVEHATAAFAGGVQHHRAIRGKARRLVERARRQQAPARAAQAAVEQGDAVGVARALRDRDLIAVDVRVYDHFGTVGVKNQLKIAEESKAPIALIMGQKEAMDDMVILRDVKSGMQELFSYDKIVIEVKKRLER